MPILDPFFGHVPKIECHLQTSAKLTHNSNKQPTLLIRTTFHGYSPIQTMYKKRRLKSAALLKNQPDDIQPAFPEVEAAYHSLIKLIE